VNVLSHESAEVDARAKGPQIAGYIGRAAGVGGFFFHLHDRHRSFWRDAGNAPPHKFVEHHIAHDEELARGGGRKKML
jgi:hypothetical protein